MEHRHSCGGLAPRPFFVVARIDDPIFPKDGIQETVAAARRAYVVRGVADRLATFYEPGAHAFSPTMRAAAYAWLDGWLAPAPMKSTPRKPFESPRCGCTQDMIRVAD
jgi:hypothetical protein